MARKLFLLVAIISLVALTQATPGLATTYDLPSGGDTWTETFPLNGLAYTPGDVGSLFSGQDTWGDGSFWQIGSTNATLTNTVEATVETDEFNWFHTFTYTYDASVTPGEVRFTVSIPEEGVFITSYDAEFTITATYSPDMVESCQADARVPWFFC